VLDARINPDNLILSVTNLLCCCVVFIDCVHCCLSNVL
jgi:hypothetical protein